MVRITENNPEIIPFKTTGAWGKWLSKNHQTSDGVWLHLYKKNSGIKSITHAQALEEALCYGWIDGQAKPFDEKSWIQKFTPRRKKSIWSKRNTELAEKLIKLGKMKPAGLKEVEAAKTDGRWQRAYDSPRNITIPHDFLKKLSGDKKAKKFFETLNKANVYAIAWRLQTAKKPETRKKRMDLIFSMLSRGEKIY